MPLHQCRAVAAGAETAQAKPWRPSWELLACRFSAGMCRTTPQNGTPHREAQRVIREPIGSCDQMRCRQLHRSMTARAQPDRLGQHLPGTVPCRGSTEEFSPRAARSSKCCVPPIQGICTELAALRAVTGGVAEQRREVRRDRTRAASRQYPAWTR